MCLSDVFGRASAAPTSAATQGFDGVKRKKGTRYFTLVYDLEHGKLPGIDKDLAGTTLSGFFDELGYSVAGT